MTTIQRILAIVAASVVCIFAVKLVGVLMVAPTASSTRENTVLQSESIRVPPPDSLSEPQEEPEAVVPDSQQHEDPTIHPTMGSLAGEPPEETKAEPQIYPTSLPPGYRESRSSSDDARALRPTSLPPQFDRDSQTGSVTTESPDPTLPPP